MEICNINRVLKWGLVMMFFAGLVSPLQAQEKETTYQFQGINFASLNAAAEYMRHNTWYAGQAAPSANWIQYSHRVQASPGAGNSYLLYRFKRTAYTEVPGYPAYMTTTSPDCAGCPIWDGFGNDFCTANIYTFCLSDGPIIDHLLELASKPLCQATVDSYPSYAPYLDNLGGFKSVWQFPNLDPIRASGFVEYHGDLEYTGYWSGCGSPETGVQTIYPHSSVYCPAGYNQFYRSDTRWECGNPLLTRIYEIGAVSAEPTMACSVENPCHPTTGIKSLTETDFTSPTLTFTRSYHSTTPYSDLAGLGRGWTHDYVQRILDFPDLAVSARKLLDGRGNIEHFECTDAPVCSMYRSISAAGKVLMPITGGWLYRAPDGEQRTFDADGKLQTIERMADRYVLLRVSYNADETIDTVTDQFGRQMVFSYNADGLLDALRLPSGDAITFDYDDPNPPAGGPVARQNLVKLVRQDATERRYHYEDSNLDGTPRNVFLLTGITDELGARYATYAYDERARVIRSEHAGGAGAVTLNYTHRPGDGLNWSVTEVTGPLGEVTTYDMGAGPFRKLKSIAGDRGVLSVAYDSVSGWRSVTTDREQNQTLHQYDGLHETRRTEAAGTADQRVIETDWDNALNRVSELREQGKTTHYTYNARGQILTRTESDTASLATRRWTYTYYEPPSPGPLIGQIKIIDGPRTDVSDITSHEYYTIDHPDGDYRAGDLKAIVNALGHRTEYLQYDADGRPLRIRDANNVLTELAYHARGWLSSRTTGGATTSFTYDDVANLTRLTQADGSFMAFAYDAAHRMYAMEDNYGNRIEYTLDADGNRIAEKTYDAGGILRRQLHRVYDQLNRLTTLLDGNDDPTAYSYDNNGNRTSVTDANLNRTSFEYDALDRLTRTVDALLGETVVDYDARDNLVSITDPLGNVTRYGHDGLDNQILVDSPDTGITTYEYDEAGNRTAVIDARNVRVEYFYDVLNRLTDIMYPDSTLNVSFGYDAGNNAKGRLSSSTDAAGTVNYAYDLRGNLVREIRTIGSAQYITAYDYNAAGRLIQMTYPSGMVIDYTLNAAGRIIAVDSATQTLAGNVRYEPFGSESSFTYGNGLTYSASFDQDYELDQIQSGNALDWVLNRDPVGHILSISDQLSGSDNQTFTYDDLDRLASARGNYPDEFFEYDANGNRRRYLNGVVDDSYTYEPQSNRLAAQNGWTFSRDEAGNRSGKLDAGGFGQLYRYANHKRLTQTLVRDGSGDTVVGDYVYDGRGRRISKTVSGVTHHFVYGPSGELLGVYRSNGDPLAEYVYLHQRPLAVFTTRTAIPPPTGAELIIDNDVAGTSFSGSWDLKNNKNAYGEKYRLGDKTDTYRWTPQAITGTFEIYAWWVSSKNYSHAASYEIRHNGVAETVAAGHDLNGGQWNLLGTFAFNGSGDEYVELHSGDGAKISADAIRFTPVGNGSGETGIKTESFFIHGDHLGTPRQVTDDTQAVVWRWDSPPFGNSAPDEDPDADGAALTLNLRFPGQYYDAESGLNYNHFRTYDPAIGRYLESDPIGLTGHTNTFGYAENDPTRWVDPYGLMVTGDWIRRPKVNIADYGLNGVEFISPYLNEWGFLKILRVHGFASGFVNIDVHCSDPDDCESKNWDIHESIGVAYTGYKDLGPNVAAAGVGSAAGPLAGLTTGIFTVGGSALESLLGFLKEVETHGGEKLQWLYRLGPTLICQGSKR